MQEKALGYFCCSTENTCTRFEGVVQIPIYEETTIDNFLHQIESTFFKRVNLFAVSGKSKDIVSTIEKHLLSMFNWIKGKQFIKMEGEFVPVEDGQELKELRFFIYAEQYLIRGVKTPKNKLTGLPYCITGDVFPS